MDEETLDGASLVSKALERQGIKYAFGVVGIPIMEIAVAMQGAGIRYIGMRNEQSVSYSMLGSPFGLYVE